MGGIDQHHARDFVAIEAGVKPDIVSTHRMADQNVGRGDAPGLE